MVACNVTIYVSPASKIRQNTCDGDKSTIELALAQVVFHSRLHPYIDVCLFVCTYSSKLVSIQ